MDFINQNLLCVMKTDFFSVITGGCALRLRVGVGVAGVVSLGFLFPPVGVADGARVTDPTDMADSSGDIRAISVQVEGDNLVLSMTVQGVAAPSVEQTPTGMANRYYYHWLLDTDNNPATGRSNSEYEGTPTGLASPIGYERVIMVGWRDGKPNGVEAYDPLDEDAPPLVSNFAFQASGSTLTAVVPLADLGLAAGQTIAVSAFQEGASNDWQVDWIESATLALEGLSIASGVVSDPLDMADSSGDIQGISVHAMGDHLYLSMTVQGVAAPSVGQTPTGMVNRYYYHWLLDTDNNPATGRSNSEYEGNPTGLLAPIGYERVIMIGWRDGKPNGVEAYDPLDEDAPPLVSNFAFQASGNTLTAVVSLADLGLVMGQTIAVSAFQEGASSDWQVDWIESDVVTLDGPALLVAEVSDPSDMADSSGDIQAISAHVEGADLHLTMTVVGVAAPSIEQTPAGMVNRYYYHWLLDTDNNPATGRSNAEYEGTPTGLVNPIGYERVVMIGWRDGKPNGIEAYDPLDEDAPPLVSDFAYQASGNTLTAVIPLADLGLVVGQTIAVSAFQEGASNDWQVDWIESAVITLEPPSAGRMNIDGAFTDWDEADAAGVVANVSDPIDMADSSGDIKAIQATVEGGYLYLRMSVHGIALPSVEETPAGMNNRYYYHWLLDTDNNPATGRSNSEYEGNPTGLANPIGYERVIMIGWQNGNPNGIEAYDPLDEDAPPLVSDFEYDASGDSVEARVRLSDLGLAVGQTIAISAFQEGSSNDWQVDWIESAVTTLVEGGPGNWTLPALFSGNPYGFELEVTDEGEAIVDPATVEARLDGQSVLATATKDAGVTRITGKHPALLEANSTHTVSVSLKAGDGTQTKDFVFVVAPYTTLPTSSSFVTIDTANDGFVANVTMISSGLQFTPVGGVHSNKVDLAEAQLAGEMLNEASEQYYNEVELDWTQWVVNPEIIHGPVNWYEHALDRDAILNFPNDEPFPKLSDFGVTYEGLVIEIKGYVKLDEGYHKLGLYTEGGHKISAGLDPQAPVASVFDNTEVEERVPTYFARNQFVDLVAPEAGYYPLRFLWFQSRPNQEDGVMLELFSEKDRQLHLLNDASNPDSLLVYRAGVLIDPDFVNPTVSMQIDGNEVVIEWTGMLQSANALNGTWNDYADDSQSPMRLPIEAAGAMFVRSRSN
jgi:hypothetical protein